MKNVAQNACTASSKISGVCSSPRVASRAVFPVTEAGFTPPSVQGKTLPCLYSNNGTEKVENDVNRLSPYHRKQAETLFQNTNNFVHRYGLENVGFLTLTFKDNVKDSKEAYRRFHSLNAHFLNDHFGAWLLVKERQKRGAWHFHLLVDCGRDIRTGADFGQFAKRDYSSANDDLRAFWKVLRKELGKYGFGRSELLPIRSNAEGVARYVGKYISKHVGKRSVQDKGVRLFSASRGFQASNVKFTWNTPGAWVWRVKVREFARLNGVGSYPGLQMKFGDRWAFKNMDLIFQQAIPKNVVYPTTAHWCAAHDLPNEYMPLGATPDMTCFKVIDGQAITAKYNKEWEFSSYETVPRRVLAKGLPVGQSALPFD